MNIVDEFRYRPDRFAAGAVAGVALLFILAPLIMVVWVSFFANKILTFPPTAYSAQWYANAFALVEFREGFLLSISVGATAMLLSLGLGIPAALALARYRFPGRELIRTVLMSPMIVPGIVSGAAIYVFYIEIEFATEQQLAGSLPGLAIAHTLLALPWTVRLMTTAFAGIERGCEEAAQNLGASPWTTFWRVTLPMARPGIVASALFGFVASFTDLEKSLFLVGPGKTTLPIAILNYLEWNMDPTIAAVATVQILLIAIALIISDRYVKLSQVF